MDTMKVAIYSRKSKFTGKGESIQNQIDLCKEYAENHFKTKDVYIYEDEGFSGGNIHRPQFKKLLSDCKKGKFNVLICYRLDRISRNISDFSALIELLHEHNVDFVSIREQFDTSTPMGRAMMYITSVFAQLERETAAERIKDNMYQLAKTGRWLGGNCPTGFSSEQIIYIDEAMKERKMFKLTPNPEELETVKLLFSKYIEFQSLSQLETYCLQNNITTKEDNDFGKQSLRVILTNPVYAIADIDLFNYLRSNNAQIANEKEEFDGKHGMMVYNKNLVKKGKAVKAKDMSEWICSLSKHKGIIPGKEWVLVQQTLMKNKEKAPFQGSSYAALLSGLIKCKFCGSNFKIKYGQINKATGSRYFYYVCSLKDLSKGVRCSCPNLRGEWTNELVIDDIKHMIKTGLLNNIDNSKRKLSDKSKKLADIEEKIKSNQKAIKNLVKRISLNENDIIIEALEDEIRSLQKENKELEHKLEIENVSSDIFNLELYRNTLIQFTETIDTLPLEAQRKLIKIIVDRIETDGRDFDVILYEM